MSEDVKRDAQDAQDEKKLRYTEVDLSQVLDEEDPFAAHGVVRLKVQRGREVRIVAVTIRSVPQDVVDQLTARAPKPPLRADPKTRQLAPDPNDEKYQEALRQHNERMSLSVVGHGIHEELRFRDGRPAASPEEKTRALQERGLSMTHFLEIASSILNLTQWTEEERGRYL